jgi:hypothetical protein
MENEHDATSKGFDQFKSNLIVYDDFSKIPKNPIVPLQIGKTSKNLK